MSRAWPCYLVLVFCLVACAPEPSGSRLPDDDAASQLGLSDAQAATLSSLQRVDDYPLYVMHHYAPEGLFAEASEHRPVLASFGAAGEEQWACSLFAALADPESRIFARNFDWEFSPALLLFNYPPDGYTSVSMVDIEYLGFAGEDSADLTRKPLGEILGLLDAPRLPFDGMNEAGLVMGMAAVPEANVPADPGKDTVDSLGIIRLALDEAATVEEAVQVMQAHNVDFENQVPLHYLLADAAGETALVEYHAGQIHVVRSGTDWHHATNFQVSAVGSPAGQCQRYDAITEELESSGGHLDFNGALSLLEQVVQPHTQWSLVYNMSSGEIHVVMGRAFGQVHHFSLAVGH